jgi:hypothetical protein
VTLDIVCRWMRAVVSNYKGGGGPKVDVGADVEAASFATLVAPATTGAGAAVATSALPIFKTVQVTAPFKGTLSIQISEDGVADWSPQMSFSAPGQQTTAFTAAFMRAVRVGVPQVDPGLPLIEIAADTGPGGGGGGGGTGVDIQDNTVALVGNPYSTINFEGMFARDNAGVADVSAAVVFDDDVVADRVNIRSDRQADQSPIDNTLSQITNFGSQDGTIEPAATGATGVASTIGGGNDNTASGTGSTVPGGRGNTATGDDAVAQNELTLADATASTAIGQESYSELEGGTAHATGRFDVNGDAQTARWVMRGTTPGAAPAETVILTGGKGASGFPLNRTYAVKVTAAAVAIVAGDAPFEARAAFEFATFLIYPNGGAGVLKPLSSITITPIASDEGAEAGAEEWTMNVQAVGGAMQLSFITGGNAAEARVVARIVTTEVDLAP